MITLFGVWRRVLAVAVVGLASCGSSPAAISAVTVGPAAAAVNVTTTAATAVPAAITLKADGAQDTAPFTLESGRYKSTWQAFDDCEYFGDLKPGNFSYALRAASPTSGETYINGVKAGEYYIRMNTGPSPDCRWQITLTRA